MKAVLDTMVLQKANASMTRPERANRRFATRIRVIARASGGDITPLYSLQLIREYRARIQTPRNDIVRLFLELLERHGEFNWKSPWTGNDQDNMRKCKFPNEDKHVLRTAIKTKERTYIISEEQRILAVKNCIKRLFDVAIADIDEV